MSHADDHRREFWIDHTEQRDGRQYVTGRVHEGPISVDDKFVAVFPLTPSGEQFAKVSPRTVGLRVASIYVKGVGNVREIFPVYSGELELIGQGWESLRHNDVLQG